MKDEKVTAEDYHNNVDNNANDNTEVVVASEEIDNEDDQDNFSQDVNDNDNIIDKI